MYLAPSPADGRIRFARLTPAGLAERALLDERSDELASSILAPLDDAQRPSWCRRCAASGD